MTTIHWRWPRRTRRLTSRAVKDQLGTWISAAGDRKRGDLLMNHPVNMMLLIVLMLFAWAGLVLFLNRCTSFGMHGIQPLKSLH